MRKHKSIDWLKKRKISKKTDNSIQKYENIGQRPISKKNPYSNDILKHDFNPKMTKISKELLFREINAFDVKYSYFSIKTELLCLRWDYEHGYMPEHKIERLRLLEAIAKL